MNYILLAQNIKNARKNKNYTQEQLAEWVNCSTVFISQIETGVRVPSLETLYKIADVLGVTIDTLFAEDTNSDAFDFYKDKIISLLQNRPQNEIQLIFNVVSTLCESLDKNEKK